MAVDADSWPEPAHGDDRVFVLRFWLERSASPAAEAVWRARVTSPSGGPPRHAAGVAQALALVQEAMRDEPAAGRRAAPD